MGLGSSGEGVQDDTDEVGVIDEVGPTTELHPSALATIRRGLADPKDFPVFSPLSPCGESLLRRHWDGPALLTALLCAFISSTLPSWELWMCSGARQEPSPPMNSGRPAHSVPFLQKVPKLISNALCAGFFGFAPDLGERRLSGSGELERPSGRYVGGFGIASNSA